MFKSTQLSHLRICSLLVDCVLRLYLVKGASRVEQNLPDVVYVSLPLVEAAAKVELVSQRIHSRMEYRVVKHQALHATCEISFGIRDDARKHHCQ